MQFVSSHTLVSQRKREISWRTARDRIIQSVSSNLESLWTAIVRVRKLSTCKTRIRSNSPGSETRWNSLSSFVFKSMAKRTRELEYILHSDVYILWISYSCRLYFRTKKGAILCYSFVVRSFAGETFLKDKALKDEARSPKEEYTCNVASVLVGPRRREREKTMIRNGRCQTAREKPRRRADLSGNSSSAARQLEESARLSRKRRESSLKRSDPGRQPVTYAQDNLP